MKRSHCANAKLGYALSILDTTEDGRSQIKARAHDQTVWLTLLEMVDQIITSNGFPLLSHAGSISHEQMEARTAELYLRFDQDRKWQEAIVADQRDEVDMRDLESTLKRRQRP